MGKRLQKKDVTRKKPSCVVTTAVNVDGFIMLSWALTFLIIALIAGVLGLTGIAGTASHIAWVLFVVFLILFLVSFVTGRRIPPG